MTSPDGITWTARSSASDANGWYSVCWSPELSIFVAVAYNGTNRVMTSNIGMPNSKSVVKALPTQMSVLPNGNVGIGTSSPQTALQIGAEGTDHGVGNWGTYDIEAGSLSIINENASSGTDTKTVIDMARYGLSSYAYGTRCQIKIGRYENSSNGAPYNAKTRIDFDLLDAGVGHNALNNVMTLQANGNVGIGTPTPGAKLHVNGTVKTANLLGDTGITYSCSGYGKHYFTGTNHWAGNTSATAGSYGDYDAWNYYGTYDFIYLAKFTGAIVSTSGFIHLSDRRIKRDIVDVPDNESLNKVLQIEVRKYGYKDYINKGTYKVTGFIAQEVLAVFPEAVSTKNDGVLPNIYKISTGFEYDNSNNKLTLNVTEIEVTEDIKIDCKLQLKFINHETLFEEYIEVLLKEINETNIVVEGVENIKEKIEKTQEIFIYGSHIDNLHTLNKDKIFTIHHGAIQELHKIIVAEKEKVATLESELAAIKQHLGI